MKNLNDMSMGKDALMAQKQMLTNYNHYATECKNDNVRSVFLDILEDEHNIQNSIFKEMNKRGWQPNEDAKTNKIEQIKCKYV